MMALGFHFPGPLFLAFTCGSQLVYCFVLFFFFSRREFAQEFVVVVVGGGGGQRRGVVYLRAHSRWPFEWTWAIRPVPASSPAVFDAVCRREKAQPFRSHERNPGLSVVNTEPFEPGGVPRGHPAL